MGMDQATIGYVSYRWHRICNHYSLGQLGRVLDFTDLKPGDRACDLGCGNGYVAVWMAERLGLEITALERFAAVAELARQAASRPLARGRVAVVEGRAPAYLAEAGAHRLVSAIGAIDLFPDLVRPAEMMAALAPSVAPGGWLLWGDPFWKIPPSPRLDSVFGAARYADLSGWVAAGEAAGLEPRYTAVSTEADWEEFFWRMNASLEDWAAEHPADAGALRKRAAMLRSIYLEEGREGMGFGLYLFRRPFV
jgi:SAM-dependent methyltransferase